MTYGNVKDMSGEVYALHHKELVDFIESLVEIKIFTKDWIFVLDKLDHTFSIIRKMRIADEEKSMEFENR